MRALTFKETVANDVHGVFLNLEEFADRHTIKYDGQVYADIPISLQDVEQTERQQMKDDHLPGIFRAKAVLYCAREDIGGRPPEQGKWLEINDGKNPRFFNKYQVGSSGVEMGMVRVELGRFAQ